MEVSRAAFVHEKTEYWGYLHGLLSHLTQHISLHPYLPASGYPPCCYPASTSPSVPWAHLTPRTVNSRQASHADLATNKCFSLLLEFKENNLQNFGKKPKTNKKIPTEILWCIYTFMSEDCWTWRSICCQVACPSFCQQSQHIHLGLDDHLTGMLRRCLSRDVTHCNRRKK